MKRKKLSTLDKLLAAVDAWMKSPVKPGVTLIGALLPAKPAQRRGRKRL